MFTSNMHIDLNKHSILFLERCIFIWIFAPQTVLSWRHTVKEIILDTSTVLAPKKQAILVAIFDGAWGFSGQNNILFSIGFFSTAQLIVDMTVEG